MMGIESLLIGGISILGGIGLGSLFNRLMYLLFLKIGFPIIFVGRSPLFLTGKRIPVLSVSTIMSGTQLKRSYVGSVTSPDIMSALF